MKKFLNEFKEFASRGNALDMAVGLILGTAFTTIVSSLVNDIIIPFINAITFKINLTSLKFEITKFDNSVVTINYGSFIQAVIDFLVIAFCVFVMVKIFNKINRKRKLEEKKEENKEISAETKALNEIIEILKEKK